MLHGWRLDPMIRRSLLLIVVCFLLFAPIPPRGATGAYNTFSHALICATREICLHELAHGLDQSAGWPSRTEEFQDAVSVHLGEQPGEYNWPELYAWLYAFTDGDRDKMPDELRRFYDWRLADKLAADLPADGFTFMFVRGEK